MKGCPLSVAALLFFVFGPAAMDAQAEPGPCPCVSNSDTNGDGIIDFADAEIVINCYLDGVFSSSPGPCDLCVNGCDVNCTGDPINVFDMYTVQCLWYVTAGLITMTPEECCDLETWITPDAPDPPPPTTGACCHPDGCIDALTMLECASNVPGGIWGGPNATCLTSLCPCGPACSPSVTRFLDSAGPIQFGAVDVPPIPADFFFPGSNPFIGSFQLSGGGGGGLLSSDTMIQRAGPITCPFGGFPRPCDPVSIEIVALNLAAADPITVSPDGSQWEVTLELSEIPPSPVIPGQLEASLDHANGGTLDARLVMLPKFTFTRVGGPNDASPAEVRTLDYGTEGIPLIEINLVDVPWVINLGSIVADTITPTGDGDFVLGVEELLPGDPNSQVVVPISAISKDGGVQQTFGLAPPPQTQACCMGNARCEDLVRVDCSFFEGISQGTGTTCSGTTCPALAPIPATSQWGVMVMLLLILCAGTIQFGRRRSMS